MMAIRRRTSMCATAQKAIIAVELLAFLDGRLSPHAVGLVMEGAALHRQELREAWRLAERHALLPPIAPLE